MTSHEDGNQPQMNPVACGRDSIGTFALEIHPRDNTADFEFFGQVLQAPVPNRSVVLAETDECRLEQIRLHNCNPLCNIDQWCSAQGCVAEPDSVSAGMVRVSGYGRLLELEPGADHYYRTYDFETPAPREGDVVRLDAEGSRELETFSLETTIVRPATDMTESVTMARGRPITLRWTPGLADERTRVRITMNTGPDSPESLVCTVPDNGSFDIPASLIDTYFGLGGVRAPSLSAERRSLVSRQLDSGCVSFRSASGFTYTNIDVEGLVACETTEDCAPGELCDWEFSVCTECRPSGNTCWDVEPTPCCSGACTDSLCE